MFELEELKQKSLAVKLGILPVYGEEDVNKATESAAFLIGEIVFCLAFLSVCEIPNWTRGPYETNHCVEI